MNKNIYKPRYKIAYQTKSKVWTYKDSRLRRFFNIRGRKLVRRGIFKRIVVVFNNMKWNVARRYIRPYRRKRKGIQQTYKIGFYHKQKVKHFYGKIKEEYFRNFFKKHSGSVNLRNNSFYSALERRTDMFMFRTRLLPTIYAANQFIHHQGININGRLEKSSNALVSPGDFFTLDTNYWKIFSKLLYSRIHFRTVGYHIKKKRLYTKLKKKARWIFKERRKFIFNTKNILRKLYSHTKKIVETLTLKLQLKKSKLKQKNNLKKKGKAILSELPKKIIEKNINSIKSKIILKESKNLIQLDNFFKNGLINNPNENNKFIKNYFIYIRKFLIIIKKRYIFLKNLRRKVRVWKRKNYYKYIYFLISSILLFNKNINFISRFFKDFENINNIKIIMEFWKPKISLIKDKEEKASFRKEYYNLLEVFYEKINLKKEEDLFYEQKIKILALALIKNRIQIRFGHKEIQKSNEINIKTEKKERKNIIKKNSLFYFLKYRKFKKRRKRTSPRLRPVHWYIPPYIYFDIKTLGAIYLYNPLPEEIFFGFKCSLPKVYSFYKSRGY